MRRRGVLIGGWVLATIAATVVAWAAVQRVTSEVSPSPVLPLPSGVDIAAADAPSAVPSAPAVDDRQDAAGEVPAGDPASTAQSATTQSYSLTGGTVTVRYRNGTTSLVQATPNSGFAVDVNDGGPAKVDVRFRSDDHESRLTARWDGGRPDPHREERPR